MLAIYLKFLTIAGLNYIIIDLKSSDDILQGISQLDYFVKISIFQVQCNIRQKLNKSVTSGYGDRYSEKTGDDSAFYYNVNARNS